MKKYGIAKTDPTSEPMTLDEIKQHLRVTVDDENAYIQSLIQRARYHCERVTGRQVMTATYVMTLDEFPSASWLTEYTTWVDDALSILLPFPPTASVTSIAYVDANGTTQTLATSVYELDVTTAPGRIYLKFDQSWPATRDQKKAVTITYTAGYASALLVPPSFKTAICFLIGTWYRNREAAPLNMVGDVEVQLQSILDDVMVSQYA